MREHHAASLPHPAAQHDRVVPSTAEQFGKKRDVPGPLGQDETMSPTSQRGDDIRDHLLVAGIVGHQVAVDRGDSARGGRIGVAAVVEGRQVDGE